MKNKDAERIASMRLEGKGVVEIADALYLPGEYGKVLSAPPSGDRHHACLSAMWETRGAEGRQEGKEVLLGSVPYQLVEQPPVGDQ